MTFAILMCMNMTMLLYAMIEKGIHSLFDKNVDLVTHTVTGSISFLQAHGSSDALFKASLVAVIYGVINLVLLGNCSISCRERVRTEGEARMRLKESLQCAVKKPFLDFALCDRGLRHGCDDPAKPEHYVLFQIYSDG